MIQARPNWSRLVPVAFVLLWSTGFVGARATMPYAEPMTFLTLRFAAAALVAGAIALMLGHAWPKGRGLGITALAGLLVHAVYLGGVFLAVRLGLEAGAASLIVGAQPVLTAVFAAALLAERVGWRVWAGLGLGALGIVVFVTEKLGDGLGTPAAVIACLAALLGISLGTVLQKRARAGGSVLSQAALHYAVSGLACAVLAASFETGAIVWSGEFVFGLVWLTLVLSIGAVSLLYVLIERGAATKVASLFFLVPPVAALLGWALYGETLGGQALAGMALVVLGVWLVNRRPAASKV